MCVYAWRLPFSLFLDALIFAFLSILSLISPLLLSPSPSLSLSPFPPFSPFFVLFWKPGGGIESYGWMDGDGEEERKGREGGVSW